MSLRFYACTLLLTTAIAFVHTAPASAQSDDRTAGSAPAATEPAPDVTGNSETYRQLNLFGDVFERIKAQYVDEVPDEQMIKNALNGMLGSLDPHSAYLDDKDFTDMQVQTRGEFGGLGIEVSMEEGLVKVVSPIDDTPAYRAGVLAGDYITHLDGEAIMGMTLNDAVDRMRGKVGTPIELTIRRIDVQEPVKLTIVRDVIKIQSVKSEVFDNAIGYIRVTTFNQNTETGVKKAVEDIRTKAGENLVGYVIDLRNNPGGLLDQAIAMADLFLDKGEIVSTRGRYEEDTKRDNSTPGDITGGMPIVILINAGSASASEIVAGALQDHHRAILLGTKSFGKGSVQTIIPLPGHGAMRLTTARYYTPSGRSIQAKGIEPDIIVEQAKVETLKTPERMGESDLHGALDKDKATPKEEKASPDAASVKPDEKEVEKQAELKKRVQEDYQLARALDLVRGVTLYEQRKQ